MNGAVAKRQDAKGEWLSESEIAKRLKLHRQTVAARLDDLGYEPDEERSTAKLKVHWFDDEMEFALKAAKDTVSAMKIREMRARAEKIEMQNAQTRGELVVMADAIDDMQKIISWLYQEYTVRQQKRIAAKLAKAKNVTAVRKILKSDTDTIMKNLRQNFEKFVD